MNNLALENKNICHNNGHIRALVKKDFSRAAKYYDKYAEVQKIAAEDVSNMVKGIIKSDGLIADLGAGTGFLSLNMPNYKNMYQLDISKSMCDISSRLNPSINGNMETLPFDDSVFDGVISSLALQWLENPSSTLEEVNRVLKKSGKFIFSTFGPSTLKELKQSIDLIKDSGATRVNNFLPVKDLVDSLEKSGFCKISISKKEILKDYGRLSDLLKAIRGVGGSNKNANRARNISKRAYKALEKNYHNLFCDKRGDIFSTWEVIYITAEKK